MWSTYWLVGGIIAGSIAGFATGFLIAKRVIAQGMYLLAKAGRLDMTVDGISIHSVMPKLDVTGYQAYQETMAGLTPQQREGLNRSCKTGR